MAALADEDLHRHIRAGPGRDAQFRARNLLQVRLELTGGEFRSSGRLFGYDYFTARLSVLDKECSGPCSFKGGTGDGKQCYEFQRSHFFIYNGLLPNFTP
jgi:hypothetical protein